MTIMDGVFKLGSPFGLKKKTCLDDERHLLVYMNFA